MSPPISRRLGVLAALLGATGLAACDVRLKSASHEFPTGADPSAVVVGTQPAAPSGDPPGTTPVSVDTTEITKKVETEQKPQEGDNHSHSTLAADTPQKAGGASGSLR